MLYPFFFFFFFFFFFPVCRQPIPTSTPRYIAVDDITLNCGASVISMDGDQRVWIGDMDSESALIAEPYRKSFSSMAKQSGHIDAVPYKTARISYFQFSYEFPVSPGPKFLRLYFFNASYHGFDNSTALFTVKAGSFILLSNFSASLASSSNGGAIYKEFCVNVGEERKLNVMFIPCPSSSSKFYAFINGIEIVSMPDDLYYPEGTNLTHVGQFSQFSFDYHTALEMVVRLNVGGGDIPPVDDSGMFRKWSRDERYFLDGGVIPHHPDLKPIYSKIPNYTAPDDVYRTAVTMGPNSTRNLVSNLTWQLPVDPGFDYLVRLHFCEIEREITSVGERQFIIYIDNKTAEAWADVLLWSRRNETPVYKDYVVRIQDKAYLFVALQPLVPRYGITNVILNGLEVFKLSDDNGNFVFQAESRRKKTIIVAPGTNVGIWVVLTCVVIWKLRKTKHNFSFHPISKPDKGKSIGTGTSSLPGRSCLRTDKGKSIMPSTSSLPAEGYRHLTLEEIKIATQKFKEELVIGKGGFGKVYKGVVGEGSTTVAIKRLNLKSTQGSDEFWTEIKMLSQLRHVHVVPLVGCCRDEGEMILVYDFMANGNLRDHLYGSQNNPLSWKQRLQICIGVACGLDFLHKGWKQPIFHRDVNTTNIFLDDQWLAKVSDSGSWKTVQEDNAVKVTSGYLDPDYAQSGPLTVRSDVYSFGEVLLEVLCGRKALDNTLETEQQNLANWVQLCIQRGTTREIIDPYLKGKITPDCFMVYMEVVESCVLERGNQRPTMNDVKEKLDFALELQEIADAGKEKFNSGGQSIYLDVLSFPVASTSSVPRISSGRTYSGSSESGLEMTVGTGSVQLTSSLPEGSCPKPDKGKSIMTSTSSLPREGCRHFTLQEIERATQNFKEELVIGKGGFGKVYKGVVGEGSTTVAIKRLNLKSTQGSDEFWTEIEMLSQLHHVHVVPLVGYCSDEGEMILIYDFMANGNLRDHLYGSQNNPLSWKQRLQICIGVARGLDYLHTGVEQPIIHRDVKTTNILLDDKWKAKVSDFGLCKQVQEDSVGKTKLKGTIGYLDPDYAQSGQLTVKSDVYSFGVVLLEVLCARKALDNTLETENRNLANWAQLCLQRGTIEKIIDPYLRGKIAPKCLKSFLKVVESCLHKQSIQRPTMSELKERLDFILKLQEITNANMEKNLVSAWRTMPVLGTVICKLWKIKQYPFCPQCRHFSLKEIERATENFKEELVIGKGRFGKVYKGVVGEGSTTVAIKRLNLKSTDEFWTEIKMLSQLRHVHVVPLVGYCLDEGEMILIYDFMANGNLRDHLYGSQNNSLSWKQRLQICIGVARGLDYLHTGMEQPIINRDVKTTNILLDDKWVAKVSDFRISRMVLEDISVTTIVNGTLGYMAPECFLTGRLTVRSDVYSFGMVLLEVLCGNLANWARGCKRRGTIGEIIDPHLKGKIAPECFKAYVEVVEGCVRKKGFRRPTMNDVKEKLDFALKLQEIADADMEKLNSGGSYSYPEVLSFRIAGTGGVSGDNNSHSNHGWETDSGTGLGMFNIGCTSSILDYDAIASEGVRMDAAFSEA